VTVRVSLYDTQRPLSRPAENARLHWTRRNACILSLEGDPGLRGLGEASPLPGFSPDTLADCRRALTQLDTTELPSRLSEDQSALVELERASRRLPARLPAARAALETALLDLWARAAGLPAWTLLVEPGSIPEPREVAALLMGEPERAVEQAERACLRGVRSFKFKIGRPGALERELGAVRDLRGALGPRAKLRLDANQSFGLEQARSCLPRFASYDLEFMEECCSLSELARLSDLGLPLALDESLLHLDPDGVALGPWRALGVRALVLKPSLLGGIAACAAWARLAAQIGADAVISHTFDGPIGLGSSAALALSVGSTHAAHGLDLEGARVEPAQLPAFANAQILPWSEPGFGLLEPSA
jgi:o-succinylbenzoate synthase